jgi:acetolactate synthase-1/2/3 large subunit
LAAEGPTVIEVTTARDAAGPFTPGWWDFPSPEYYREEQEDYAKGRALEQHL